MSMVDSRAALTRAAKDLTLRWTEVKELWQDAQTAEFEKTYLEPLEMDVRGALAAMDQMGQIIQAIESDCE